MKTIKHLSATLLALIATITLTLPFTACNNDDDDADIDDTPTLTVKSNTLTITTNVTVKQPKEGSNYINITDVADLTFHCVDQNGKDITLDVTASTGEFKLENTTFPCEYSLYFTFTLKPGATIDPAAQYYIDVEYTYVSDLAYANNNGSKQEHLSWITPPNEQESLAGAELEAFCSQQHGKRTFKFDADGKRVQE